MQVPKKIRLPLNAYRQNYPFSITVGTFQRYPWFQKYPRFVAYSIACLVQTTDERKTHLYAWCFMPDHVHLLIQDKNVLDFVRLFKGRVVKKARAFQSQRKLWQRSFYDHALRKEEQLNAVARYIWNNPVRAGLVEKAEDFDWSGSNTWPNWRSFYTKNLK